MKLVRIFAVVVAVCLVALISSPAQAQCAPGGPFGGLPGFGAFPFFSGYGGASPYSMGRIPVPPYFSIHPPVYYSAPVPRTYGYSPYAYPGSVRTPDLKNNNAEAAVIINPHATQPVKNDIEKNSLKTAKVEMIFNPFARSQQLAAE